MAEGRKQKTKKREDAVEKMITDDSGIPVQDGLAHPRIYRIVHPKGDRSATALMYPIGYVARACGCSPQNIRKMEHEGTIPAPLFKSSGGGRIYTEDQIAVIAHHYTRLRFEKAANGRAKINKKGDRISVQSLRHLRAAIAQDWDLLINGLKPERFHPTPTDPHKTEEQDHG